MTLSSVEVSVAVVARSKSTIKPARSPDIREIAVREKLTSSYRMQIKKSKIIPGIGWMRPPHKDSGES
ncbi:hypothetical protein [Burkholderia dolosa]|uniref:hypothetical protein n=1 Tax=Burkholderia dolosa TaxID=152500 RepID=UPI001590B7C3|nr:hypothetical protein [Burkholderia dolosa]MBR8459665.1 hypothetical protein [Burkholderia dolosa]MBY4755087.1 hypothetical protein [Burkholderia dolosa]MDN7423891.1 hypothetical protein [Burkholderia dolosa]